MNEMESVREKILLRVVISNSPLSEGITFFANSFTPLG